MGYINGTKKHNIFLLDNDKFCEKNNLNNKKEIISSDIVALLAKEAKKSEYKFIHQKLKENINTYEYNVEFIFSEKTNDENLLKSFCRLFLDENSKACKFITKTYSSIMFVWKNDNIFVITTGQGFRIINPYIVTNFGMQVASMLNPNLLKVAAISSNSIDSIIHKKSYVYSKESDFFNINELDSIYNEIVGRLYDEEEIKELFNISAGKEKTSITILAKDYIQFGSVADFSTLLKIISKYDNPKIKLESDRFNQIKPLTNRMNQTRINSNNNYLIKDIYSIINSDKLLNYDLFNRDVEKFIHADFYSIQIDDFTLVEGDIIDKDFIISAYKKYLEINNLVDSEISFYMFIEKSKINSLKEELFDYITTDKFLDHISGELIIEKENYYLIYGKYYKLENSYIERLNQALESKKLELRYVNEIDTVWKEDDKEDDFNANVANSDKSDFIHLHKLIIDNIEFADLIKYDSENKKLKIVHVKDGFNGSMRALERQVVLSIRELNNIKNNDEFIKKLYLKAIKDPLGKKLAIYFPKYDDFRDKLILSDIQYIIAIKTNNRNLLNSKSNIAKYCLISLINYCLINNVDLKINFIKTDY